MNGIVGKMYFRNDSKRAAMPRGHPAELVTVQANCVSLGLWRSLLTVKSLEKVVGEANGENEGWKVRLIIFVGGTRGSVDAQIFNNNLKELGVV